MEGTSTKHVLVIVQNLPVPLDRRVWLECQVLRDGGYDVTVICPKGPGDPDDEVIDGIRILKYEPAPQAEGLLGYAREFAESWLKTAVRSRKVWRNKPFDVIQACNPPDTYWALAALYRPFGVRFVFDQHDLNPELFRSRFHEPEGLGARIEYSGLAWLERMTYRFAHHVVSTNDSYRRVALTRGRLPEGRVTVVRSGPDTAAMRPVLVEEDLKRGRKHLLVYLGIMGPQDGVDLLLHSVRVLVHELGRDDVHTALLGFGDRFEDLQRLAAELDIMEHVTFTGRADGEVIAKYLSAADIGVGPDPKSPLNDVSTMNKHMEYMAYALPIVTYDLAETRVSAGEAAVYVESEDFRAFALAIGQLLDDPDRRATMARLGRERVVHLLDWAPQARAYLGVFDRLLGTSQPKVDGAVWPDVDRRTSCSSDGLVDAWGRRRVDLRNPAELEELIRDRGIVRHSKAG